MNRLGSASTSTAQPSGTSLSHIRPLYRVAVDAMIESPITRSRLSITLSPTNSAAVPSSCTGRVTGTNGSRSGGTVEGRTTTPPTVGSGANATWSAVMSPVPAPAHPANAIAHAAAKTVRRQITVTLKRLSAFDSRGLVRPQLVTDLREQFDLGRTVVLVDLWPLEAVVGLDDEEQDQGDGEEVDEGAEDQADREERVADRESDGGDVRLAEDQRDQGRDQRRDDLVDDRLEVQRHHQPDGDDDDVTPVDELLVLQEELLHACQSSTFARSANPHRAVHPPSTMMLWPVRNEPAGEASSNNAPSSSASSPMRGIGELVRMNC